MLEKYWKGYVCIMREFYNILSSISCQEKKLNLNIHIENWKKKLLLNPSSAKILSLFFLQNYTKTCQETRCAKTYLIDMLPIFQYRLTRQQTVPINRPRTSLWSKRFLLGINKLTFNNRLLVNKVGSKSIRKSAIQRKFALKS